MKTSSRFSPGTCALAVALALMGAAAGAAGPRPEAPRAGQATCAQIIEAAQWRADAAGTHLRMVLGDAPSADLDGMADPCRLADGDLWSSLYINYGIDADELLARLDQLLGPDALPLSDQEREQLLHRRVQLLQYLREVERLARGGAGTSSPVPPDAWRHDGDVPAGAVASMSAVPEPAGYATLLAGLALLGALRLRLSGGRARPAVRR